MNPRLYESLGALHQDDLRREAAAGRLLAAAREGGRAGERIPGLHARRWLQRLAARWRRPRLDVAHPRRDLRPARRP